MTFALMLLKGLWGWIAGHSPRELAIAGGVLAVGLLALYAIHHERAIGRDEQKAATDKIAAQLAGANAQLQECRSTNASNDAVLARVQLDKSECLKGREADQAAQASALATHQAAAAKAKQDAAAARAKLQVLLAGRCKAWADQPACGAEP